MAMFALPLAASVGIAAVLARTSAGASVLQLPEDEGRVHLRLGGGAAVALVGAGCWILTEALCDSSDFFKWLPGHALWHVLMSTGLLNCLLFGVVLRCAVP